MLLFRYKRIWLISAAPAAYGLLLLAERFPGITESFYSTGIYPILAGFIGRITGLFPFSVAELLIYIGILLIITYLAFQMRALINSKNSRGVLAAKLCLNVLGFFSVWYCLFVLFCGFNYHRLNFSYYSGLYVRDSSPQELAALCGELVDKANGLRPFVNTDENGRMISSYSSPYRIAEKAGTAYEQLAEKYPVLGGYTPRPKPVLISRKMSYLNLVGIFIPFTYEANVNVDIVDYSIPSSMMHELAHYKGFMREDEANFISYLACSASGDTDYEYSGTLLALIHSSNALYSTDMDMYREVMGPLSEDIRGDLEQNSVYWKRFEGPVAEVSTAVNNTYLRVNRQSDGVKSYGRMVDLMLADYRMRHGLV